MVVLRATFLNNNTFPAISLGDVTRVFGRALIIFFKVIFLKVFVSFTVEPQYLELPREIEITSSYRGFEQKDQKHLIKVILCLYKLYCKDF